jgi:hypothetical protein
MKNIIPLIKCLFKQSNQEIQEAPRFEEWFLEMNPRTPLVNVDEIVPVRRWTTPKQSDLNEAPRFEEWFNEMNPRTAVPNVDEFAEVLYNFKFNKDNSNEPLNAN